MLFCCRTLRLLLIVLAFLPTVSGAKRSDDIALIRKMWAYPSTVDTSALRINRTFVYQKTVLKTDKRNVTLMCVPTMFAVSKGNDRKFVGETYNKIAYRGLGDFDIINLTGTTTTPHRRKTMTNLLRYLTPEIYEPDIVKDYMLSPFNRHNRIFYKYKVRRRTDGTAEIFFRPRTDNTCLVKGSATVDMQTGQVIRTTLKGEYDMVHFTLTVRMFRDAPYSLLPEECRIDAQFRFLGNRISNRYDAVYGLSDSIPDSLRQAGELAQMAAVRPVPLTGEEEDMLEDHYRRQAEKDSLRTTGQVKKSWARTVLWDAIGDNVLNRVKSRFGKNDEGYLRINPILNPLYMGYSDRRGFTYKFDMRLNYNFSERYRLTSRLKAGYAFKQKQFYFRLPVRLTYSKSKNRYVEMELNNGSWIRNGIMNDYVKEILGEHAFDDNERAVNFKDLRWKIITNFDANRHWGFQAGMILHRRSAVEKDFYRALGLPVAYRSAAPLLSVQYRPLGYGGPTLTADYERGIKGMMRSDMDYERWEFDAQWIIRMRCMRSLQMRFGYGFYTNKGKETTRFFLDYENFRDINIEGGWNDSWSGRFELVNRNWYNASDYYIRGNFTYESPLLAASWLPVVGRFIEAERVYFNILAIQDIWPYTEAGYGFTTRLFSIGVFMSHCEGRFDRFGFKLGFELFRDW